MFKKMKKLIYKSSFLLMFVMMLGCLAVPCGTSHAARTTDFSMTEETSEAGLKEKEAAENATAQEADEENNFLIYFFAGIIILLAIVAAVVVVIVSGSSAIVAVEEDEE